MSTLRIDEDVEESQLERIEFAERQISFSLKY